MNYSLKFLEITLSLYLKKEKCQTTGKPDTPVYNLGEIERWFPQISKFYNKACGKIGKQKLGNNFEFMKMAWQKPHNSSL